jgi:uncharacterized phage protein gp47/JayE
MGTTPVCTIDSTGIHRPSLATILAWFVSQFQSIYGADAYLGSDSIDGEWIGLLASAVDDANAMCVSTYNAFSPSTSQGTGLSSVVKINGLARLVPSYSTAPMLAVGVAGTVITSGVVTDENSNSWSLPASVVIPNAGQIAVTATCQTAGAITAQSGTINTISNPQPGWQSATNTAAATPGNPVETDAGLRVRQSNSTMNSSTAILDGIVGAIEALPGVARAKGYQNTGNVQDSNGIPGNSIAIVVDGGDAASIANIIWEKKGGCGTYGSTIETITDAYGVPLTIAYFPVKEVTTTVAITIKQLQSFSTNVVAQIQSAIAAYNNAVGIGNGLQYNRLFAAAYLNGAANGSTYEIVSLAVARDGLTPTASDVSIAFNEAVFSDTTDIVVTVQP